MPPKQKQKQRQSVNVVVNVGTKTKLRYKAKRRVRKPVQEKTTGTGGGFINYAQTQFRPVAPTYAQITLNPNIILPATKQPLVRDMGAEVRNPLFDISDVTATTTLKKTVEPVVEPAVSVSIDNPIPVDTAVEPVTAELPENPLIPEPITIEPNPLKERRRKKEINESVFMGLEDPIDYRRDIAERDSIKRFRTQLERKQSKIRESVTSPLGKKIGEAFIKREKGL